MKLVDFNPFVIDQNLMLAYVFSMIKTLKWPYFSGCSIPWHTSRYCIDMTVRQSLLNFITSTRKILKLFKYETNLLPKDLDTWSY